MLVEINKTTLRLLDQAPFFLFYVTVSLILYVYIYKT
jgi:hypothetical protein